MSEGTGFRKVPNWLLHEEMAARRTRGEAFSRIEAWCSLDLDLYRHGRLASERAYARNWKRSRDWVRHLMQRFRQERQLPPPAARRSAARRSDLGRDHFLDRQLDRLSEALAPPSANSERPRLDRGSTTSRRQSPETSRRGLGDGSLS